MGEELEDHHARDARVARGADGAVAPAARVVRDALALAEMTRKSGGCSAIPNASSVTNLSHVVFVENSPFVLKLLNQQSIRRFHLQSIRQNIQRNIQRNINGPTRGNPV